MKRCEFVEWLKARGWFSSTGRVFHHETHHQHRYIVDEFEVRLEVANVCKSMWSMTRHGNLSEMSVNPGNGKLRGFKPYRV